MKRIDLSQSQLVEPEKRFVELVRDERDAIDYEPFDRIAYASHVLRLLAPRALTVALCPGGVRLIVKEGHELAAATARRWAVVSIPATASRAHIALALTQLVGRHVEPYLYDLLLAPSSRND